MNTLLHPAPLERSRGAPPARSREPRAAPGPSEPPAGAMPDPNVVRKLHRFVAFVSLLAIAVGLLGLVGWMLDVAALKSVFPGHTMIKPNAALALVLCGAALWLLRPERADARRWTRWAGQALAGLVALVGLLTLSEHIVGWDLGIDRIFFLDSAPLDASGSARPALMAPVIAFDFLLLGLALLSLDWTVAFRAWQFRPAQLLAFGANTGAIVGLLNCLLGSHPAYSHIALQTAVTVFVLSLAAACARTGWGVGALLASSSDGGLLTRRLWPAAIFVPLLIGTVSWKGYTAGLFTEWGAVAVMIVAMIGLLAGLTVWSGQSIDASDTRRRHTERSLHRSEEELREAQRLARVGSWWWVPSSDTVTWSEGLYRIAARDPRQPPPGFRDHATFYTAESFARLSAAVDRAVQTGMPFGLDLELVRPDGSIRSVTSRGEAERDAAGHVVLVRGSVHDVTEHRRAEKALRDSEANLNKAQEIAHLGSWHLDMVRNQLTWSAEVFRIFGLAPGEPLTYEAFLRLVHPEDRENVAQAWAAALQGAAYDIEHRVVVNGGIKWVRERAQVEFDAAGHAIEGTGTVQDITERRRAQDELLRLNRAHRALSSCNEALIRATEESAWLHQVCSIVVGQAGYRFCWVGRAENDAEKSVTAVATGGVNDGYLEHVRVTWGDTPRGRGPAGTCIRTGTTQIVADTATDPRFLPWRAEALKRGYGSVIAIPLVVENARFGSLNIYAAEAGAFRAEEVTLLSELANDLAFGIAALRSTAERRRAEEALRTLNAELDQRVRARTADLEAARDREAKIGFKIQQMLLLTQPPSDVPGLDVAALTIPSQRIDGDFYDFFTHEKQRLDVIVADVMGKGIPAALVAAATKSNFLEALCHLIAMSRSGELPEPKEIVTLAHADMVRQLIDLESFVTLSYARFDPGRRLVHLVDCGHTGMMIVRAATGTCEILHGDNLPLGIRQGEIFDQMAVTFEAGDLFVFFSDGITDLRDPAGEFYGIERLIECVRLNRGLPPRALVDTIRGAAMSFAQTERLTDDLTCVAVRIADVQPAIGHSHLEIHSDLTQLQRVRDFVREVCRPLATGRLAPEAVAALELAVNEAASNIMKHAYQGRADQRIQLDAQAFPDRLSIQLHHLGDSFDAATVSPPAFNGSRESGFGLYLMAKSVDEVRYSRDDRGRHCITLVKMLGR